MIKKLSLTLAVVALSLTAGEAFAQLTGSEVAVYDPATGNVVLNSLSNVGGIQADGSGVPNGTANALGGFVTPATDSVSWLFFSPLNGDGHNLGNIFPLSLPQTDFDGGAYSVGLVITGSGISTPTSIPITGGLTDVIPEPATYLLAGIGMLGLAAVRRRLA